MSAIDLLVLGTGTAGGTVARAVRKAGWDVAIADPRPFGGTCALRGCEPKKVFWTLAAAIDQARRLAPVGLVGGDALALDWAALQRFKQSFTQPVPDDTAQDFEKLGIAAYRGPTQFLSADTVAIGDRTITARNILIATGAKPAPLPIEGAQHLKTSEDFLALDRLPARLVVVGGGYIAFELGHIAARGGAAVTLLNQDDKPLAGFDRSLVARLVEETRRLGITLETNTEVVRIEQPGTAIARQNGAERRFEADMVLHAAGRVPNFDDLALDRGAIECDGARLKLDLYLRSVSNPRIFVAGDAASAGPALTPVASIDAHCVIRNLLDGVKHEPNYRGVPSVVFTIPPLTRVGLTVEEAETKGLSFDLREGDMAGYESVRRLRQEAAGYRILVERGSNRLLGAHLLGPGSEEAINLFALAIRNGLGAEAIADLATAYPTFGSNLAGMVS